MEVHYPAGMTFTCGECAPEKKLTAIDSYASLLRATPRPALAAVKPATPITPGQRRTGTLTGQSGGAFATFAIAEPGGAPRVLTLNYGPFDAGQAHAVGLNVYQNGALVGNAHGQATGLGDKENSSTVAVTVPPSAASGSLLLQVFNYSNDAVTFTLSVA